MYWAAANLWASALANSDAKTVSYAQRSASFHLFLS